MESIAKQCDFPWLNRKGDGGQLIEQLLGIQSSSTKGPDLPEIGLEIKTLPIDKEFRVLENTHICKITLPFSETDFFRSSLWLKTRHILFVPIIGQRKTPMCDKILAQPFFWQAQSCDIECLKQDWFELSSLLRTGCFEKINAKIGECLHIRPKAAHGQDLCTLKVQGQYQRILPLGFYLRKSFTQKLISRVYVH